MGEISSGDESDAGPMSTDILEDICDGSQSHPSINRREGHYKIRDIFKQRQAECKGALLSMQSMGKGLQKVFEEVLNDISQALPIWGNLDQKFLTSFQNLETFQK